MASHSESPPQQQQQQQQQQQRGLSLGLRQGVAFGNDIFQPRIPGSLDARNNLEITTFERDRPVALFCRGLTAGGRLDVAAALRAGLLELVDEAARTAVDFPRGDPVAAGRKDVPPKPSPAHAQLRAGLGVDATARVWEDALRAGKTYVLRFAGDGDAEDDKVWCRYSDADDDDDDDDESPGKEHRRLPVALERGAAVRFTVHADPAPPALAAVFGVSPAVCHLSGAPAFKLVVEMTLASTPSSSSGQGKEEEEHQRPVTVCTQRTPFGACLPAGGGLSTVEQLVHCVDEETGEEPEWPAAFQCFDSDPWGEWPAEGQFVEITPGKPWRFEYTLERAGRGAVGGLEVLEEGARYRVELSEEAKEGFGMWMYGGKEELLRGTVEERRKRWQAGPRGRPAVRVEQVNGPVVFDVVG